MNWGKEKREPGGRLYQKNGGRIRRGKTYVKDRRGNKRQNHG